MCSNMRLSSDQQVALAPFEGDIHSRQVEMLKDEAVRETEDTHTSTMMTMSFGEDAPWIYLYKRHKERTLI